jgi:hypothetical protein
MTLLVALFFVFVGALGLLFAKRPDLFARYFLAEWQRKQIRQDGSLAWVGWALFGSGLLVAVCVLLEQIFSNS